MKVLKEKYDYLSKAVALLNEKFINSVKEAEVKQDISLVLQKLKWYSNVYHMNQHWKN